ncbi:MAG: hypothetical protein V5B30_19710 [Candidatus Accumulibacter delftensis]
MLAAAFERQRLAGQLIVPTRHFANQARAIGLLDAVGDLYLHLVARFANQGNVILADDHPHQPRRPVDDVAEQLAFLHEALRQVLRPRQLEGAGYGGDHQQ